MTKRQSQKPDTKGSEEQLVHSPRTRTKSSPATTANALDSMNYDNATMQELFASIRELINGGTISNGNQFRAYLKLDLQTKANNMINALERKHYQNQPTSKETADIGCNTTQDTQNTGTQVDNRSEDPLQGTTHTRTNTYATILKKKPVAPKKQQKKTPTILIYHKEQDQDQEATEGTTHSKTNLETLLRKELSCQEVRLHNIKPLRNEGIAISCKDENDIKTLMDRIQKSDTLKDKIASRLPAKRHPSIIIYDIPNDTTDEEIQASLKANTGIEKDLKLRFKLRGRKQETSHWIMEAPAEEFHKIIPVEKISINWEIHNIKEFYHIQRCNNCHEYGHPAAKCTATRPFCGY
ncbi:hypothetical protein AVEN_89534-1 [Araneus ventricosus]|uniref:CCHC-type domain-containing protein n=1 Tax=Araneus ventricosus TaxID=182803 RepID=A0A4Y2KKJ2_ARAVE|nr:hypothetical protein AVEN_89534-1 [Araneus ventricosus]